MGDTVTLNGKRALVVEDEMLIAIDMVEALEALGCAVVGPALRVGTACDLARTQALDFAVLDVNLAGESIEPVTRILSDRQVPFLLVTGFSSSLDLNVNLRELPRLVKPVHPADLEQALKSLLQ